MRRPLRRLTLLTTLGLGLLATSGCAQRERSVRAPKAGVQLRYALEVGTSLDGHLRIGTTRTVEGIATPLTQSVECDARLFVVRAEPDGSRIVRATFRNVELDWSVPPATGLSSEAFAKLAATTLAGMELQLHVSDRGKLLGTPTASTRIPVEVESFIDTLGRAAALGFVELPAKPTHPGETWSDPASEPGAPENTVEFVGMTRKGKSGAIVSNLEVRFRSAREVETPSGPRRRQLEGESQVRLDAEGVARGIDAELRDFDPLRGTAVQAVHATWTRTNTGDGTSNAVQDIDDPCDPDYVGTALCPGAATE